jgi:uncharacterized tellurite resistance protein B-like protein
MLERLERSDRLRLMKFVCSFAWADLEIQPEERDFISRMVKSLTLDEADREKVHGWLERPPAPETVDPTRVPIAHRKVFIDAIHGVISADGEISPEELESFRLFQDLVR